jgi:hypothetical protein
VILKRYAPPAEIVSACDFAEDTLVHVYVWISLEPPPGGVMVNVVEPDDVLL